jgi:5-methylcytosine-specific restriction endonuclease McrA
MDHKVPLSKGGEGVSIVNLQLLCVDCHRKKDETPRKTKNPPKRGPCEAIPALLFDWLLEQKPFF